MFFSRKALSQNRDSTANSLKASCNGSLSSSKRGDDEDDVSPADEEDSSRRLFKVVPKLRRFRFDSILRSTFVIAGKVKTEWFSAALSLVAVENHRQVSTWFRHDPRMRLAESRGLSLERTGIRANSAGSFNHGEA